MKPTKRPSIDPINIIDNQSLSAPRVKPTERPNIQKSRSSIKGTREYCQNKTYS